jgi:hypothetical protein
MHQDFIPGLLFGFIIGTFLTLLFCGIRESGLKQEAIKRGHATWHVHQNGQTTFTWK